MSELVEVEVQPPGQLVAGWETARSLVGELRDLGRRAGHVTLLLGAELSRLKKALGVQKGGDRRSKTQTASLIWSDLCEAETGLSHDTCQRAMKLATAARRMVPELLELDDVGFASLPEDRQTALLEGLRAVSDGRTMSQMWFEFGLCKDGRTAPPKPEKGDAPLSLLDSLSLEQRIAAALADAETVGKMISSGMWSALSDADLGQLDLSLAKWRESIMHVMESRAVNARKLEKKGGRK